MKSIAIILANGSSCRFGETDKNFAKIFGQTSLLESSLSHISKAKKVDEILLVCENINDHVRKNFRENFPKLIDIISGGKTRFLSLRRAIDFLVARDEENTTILVHNAANPYATSREIDAILQLTTKQKNIIAGFFTPNSVKQVAGGVVQEHLDRDHIFEAQTPQISDLKTFRQAIDFYDKNIPNEDDGSSIRDESELLSLLSEPIHIYETSPQNQKITFPSDIQNFRENFANISENRIGFGYDSHRFSDDRNSDTQIILGGINIPSDRSLLSNSDGDVVLHTLTNALLSGYGLPTLNSFARQMCKDGEKNSRKYFDHAVDLVRGHFGDFQFSQVQIALEMQTPKIAPYHEAIQKNLAKILSLDISCVGLTYTTGEALTDAGRGDGVACWAIIF